VSPIIDIQYRLRELGRIRMGKKGNKGAPVKLKTWRLTSASKELLEAAASEYGGTVEVWKDAPNEGEHFQLTTESDTLEIVIPPNDAAFDQWFELWAGGGCKKRCDGVRQYLADRPCSCPKDPAEREALAKDGKACKYTTRFNVVLPKIPDVGVWRLESHGYYAAVELAGFSQLIELMTKRGQMIAARLRMDHRSVKRQGQSVRRFTVPVIEIDRRLEHVLQSLGIDPSETMISLPSPIEPRSLPGDKPLLPPDPEPWAIEDAEEAADVAGSEPSSDPSPDERPNIAPVSVGESSSGAPSDTGWLDDLRFIHTDQAIVAVAEEVRKKSKPSGKPIESIEDVAKASEQSRDLIVARLRAELQESMSE
jgi:hypothetical protein